MRNRRAACLFAALMVGGCASAPPTATPPTAGAGATAGSPAASESEAGQPPAAFLAVDGRGSVEGELGSYTFGAAGSDSPWLPARALDGVAAAPGARLIITLAGGQPIGTWSAVIAAAGDDQAVNKRALGESQAGGLGPAITLPAPSRGDWVLMVQLAYGDGSGSGAYYWEINVR